MENLEALAAHRTTVQRLVPLLDAIRSVAEIAWRRAERGAAPLQRYREQLRATLELIVASLDRAERDVLLGHGEGPLAVLFISSERGLCGAFNNRLVAEGLAQMPHFVWHGQPVRVLCLGSRGQRMLEAAGQKLLYAKPLPSLSVPSYAEVETAALDLLDLVKGGAFKQLWVVHNAPVRRFQYAVTVRRLLPLDMEVRAGGNIRVKPAGDAPRLLTHLLTEDLLVGLYQAVLESVTSEQLARIYTMRMATDSCRRLIDRLTLEYNAARRSAITDALMEIVAGYEASSRRTERRTDAARMAQSLGRPLATTGNATPAAGDQ
jgi:F-type H+-transporting ATPase subunit gamma